MNRVDQGLLLVAHGARDPDWARPFADVAARATAARPGAAVRLGFLELMAPTIADAGAALASAGCAEVDVLPLFLGAGGHVRRDLPRIVDGLRAAYPAVQWRLRPAVGETETVVAAMTAAAVGLLAPHGAK